jgi:Flp pilus assembly pilin Flp
MHLSRPIFRRLRADGSGMAVVEFALALPIVLSVVLAGLELTNFTIAKMRMSQLALQLADNGSRIGTNSLLTDPQISESQINDMLTGANLQSGGLTLFARGRIIISSLEPDPSNTGKYYIHWQRCRGAKNVQSSYGKVGVTSGVDKGVNMTGMGPTTPVNRQVTAPTGGGVIYIEIQYDYKPLVFQRLAPANTIREIAAMTVRDKRDFNGNLGTGIYNVEAATISSCSTFSAT